MHRRVLTAAFAAILMLPGSALTQEDEPQPEPLAQRYEPLIDTLVRRLALPDSTAVPFRAIIKEYLHDTEAAFAAQSGGGREAMEATSRAVAEARQKMDRALEGILSPEQITRATEILQELRARSTGEDDGPEP